MAISLRNAGTAVNQLSGGTINVTKPTGTVDGDVVLVAFISDSGGAMSLSGWTSIFAANGTGMRTTVLRRVASSEGASWTFTCSAGVVFTAYPITYTGVDTTTPEDLTSTGTSGTASPVTAPDITTVTDNAWHLVIFTTGSSQTSLAGPPSGYTNDGPTGGGNGDIARIDRKAISPTGATGAQTSATQAGNNLGVSVVLRPASGAATLPPGQSTYDTRTNLKALVRPDLLDYGYVDGTEFWLLKNQDRQFAGPGQWMTYDWPNPIATTLRMVNWPIANRTFTDVFKQQLVNKDVQFGGPGQWKSYDYPNPTLKRDDINRRTWTDWYKQQLIGKDLFFGPPGVGPAYDYPNPVRVPEHNARRTHIWSYVLSLIGADRLPALNFNWPNPIPPPQLRRMDFWTAAFTNLLTAVVATPVARLFGRLGFAKDINLNPPMGSGVDDDP